MIESVAHIKSLIGKYVIFYTPIHIIHFKQKKNILQIIQQHKIYIDIVLLLG